MRPSYDAVVVGLGIMGAATLDALGRRGLRVLGVEAGGPLHRRGSSHGDTRIFRRAYWEGERYLPLLNRSRAGWMHLAEDMGETIFLETGGLYLGSAASMLVRGARATAVTAGIPHEYLDASEISRRFPAFHVGDEIEALFEPDALMLFAEQARLGFLSRAVAAGAEIRYGQPVRALTPGPAPAVAGDRWNTSCGAVVLTVGGWIGRFLPDELGPSVTPMRVPIYWFEVSEAAESDHGPGRFPIFLSEQADGALIYGFPKWQNIEAGLKLGFHNRQLSPIDMEDERCPPDEAERLELWRSVGPLLPGLRPEGRGASCVYTMSPDESFLIGRSQTIEGVVYCSACSGHGFKFAPAIGEALAQLVTRGDSDLDLSAFDIGRFHAAARPV